jgi:hypothetical protein
MTVGLDDRWEPKFHLEEQRPDFDLVGTSWKVVVHETRGTRRTTFWSSSSSAGCTLIRICDVSPLSKGG